MKIKYNNSFSGFTILDEDEIVELMFMIFLESS